MTYPKEETAFLHVFFLASRDALRRHEGYEMLADYFDGLNNALMADELTPVILRQIRRALINSFWLDDPRRNDEDEAFIRDMRSRALLHTMGLLKQAEQAEPPEQS